MRECPNARAYSTNATQIPARGRLRLGCKHGFKAGQVGRASGKPIPWVQLARSINGLKLDTASRHSLACVQRQPGQHRCAASGGQQITVSEANDNSMDSGSNDVPEKTVMKAMSMPKKGQLRATIKAVKEQAVVAHSPSAAANAAQLPSGASKERRLAGPASFGYVGEGLGHYEKRRRRAEAAGAPQGAIAQYEDTAKAQQQALLRAAERNALENQRQQLDARKSGGQPAPATARGYGQDAEPGSQRMSKVSLNRVLMRLLPNFNQDVLDNLSKEVQDRLAPAIMLEQAEGEAAFKELYRKKATEELAKSGYVMLDMQPTEVGELLGDIIWAFRPAGANSGVTQATRRFKPGESVKISNMVLTQNIKMDKATRQAAEDAILPGTILKMWPTHVTVVLTPEHSDLLHRMLNEDNMKRILSPNFRLDRVLIEVTAQRQRTALENLNRLQGFNYALSTGFTGGELELKQRIQGELSVRFMLLASDKFFRAAQNLTLWASGGPEGEAEGHRWQEEIRSRLDSFIDLNRSQKLAVATAICRKLTLWQGPPGTGKTRSLLAYIELMVTSKPARPITPLLACTDTNAAVDNIVEGLVKRGIKVVRLGQPAKVRGDLRHVCLEALAGNTAKGKEGLQLKADAARLQDRLKKGGEAWENLSGEELGSLTRQAKKLQLKGNALLREASHQVLLQAEVVASTCTGAGDEHRLHGQAFRLVVLDEATQATEPSSLIPLIRGAESVVIAGDPKQLPPTVVSMDAVKMGLQVTLFDRLQEAGVEPLLLDTQYRMHPRIAEIPSELFYNKRLKSGVTAEDRPLPLGFPWPNPDTPVALVPCDHTQELQGEGSRSTPMAHQGASASDPGGASYKNPGEAALAIQVAQLMLSGEDISSLAILTPYNGQVRELQAQSQSLRSFAAPGVSIDISSVDAYQGREADVIIISTVRCNRQGRLGFVTDPRRFNVAISRPRRGLVIVGSPSTLVADPVWQKWLSWVRQQGCVSSAGAIQHAMQQIL